MIKIGHLPYQEIYDRVMWLQQTVGDDGWFTENRDCYIAIKDPKIEFLFILRWGV